MTIRPGSRYTSAEVLWVETSSRGRKQTAYLNTVTVVTNPYSVVLLREFDSMQMYAQLNYQDSDRWWVLADANPQIFYPLDIVPGQQMRVPR